MYSNILVPVLVEDGAEDKARRALDLAARVADDGAQITVLHVMEQIPAYAATYLPPDYVAQSRSAIEASVSKLAATVPNGVGHVISGHAGRTILDWAGENSVDLIVVFSHRPGMQDLLLGSTATQIVRHATSAVHVMR